MVLKDFFPLTQLGFLSATISRNCVGILPEAYSKILHLRWGWIWSKIAFHLTIKLQIQAALAWSESEHLLKLVNHFLDSHPTPITSMKVTLA